ncbi:MAG: acyl-CoA thioesterase, partial [Clostridiales bacterium]|nr:acyl-CoA thioesterase [Clostridiales bacterium]
MAAEFIYCHKVQYYETDQMGIVHHSNYIRWMEEARCAWRYEKGFGLETFEKVGVVSPVVSLSCRYI